MGKIIGITGGIASGKSTVTNFLRQKGFEVVDADAVVHRVFVVGEPRHLHPLLQTHFALEIL